jgi:hypothetical protein
MIWNYARTKIGEQLRAVAFIIVYLVAFKILVLNTPPANALQLSAGIGMVVLGLTFFLEGLFLGLMPLGERVGLQLPQRCNIAVIMFFGLLLGGVQRWLSQLSHRSGSPVASSILRIAQALRDRFLSSLSVMML